MLRRDGVVCWAHRGGRVRRVGARVGAACARVECSGLALGGVRTCGNGPMAIRREELKVAVKQGIGVLGMDHVQLSKMDRWLREPARRSMVGPRPGQTDFDLSDPWEAEVEKQLRRVAAGLVDGPVEAERQQQAGGSGARARHLAERAAGRKVAMICVGDAAAGQGGRE